MKQNVTSFGVFTLSFLCSLIGYTQNHCWNDKRIPKEWFVTVLGGYTFGYGESRYMPSYNSTYYSNWDDSSSTREISNLKNNYDQEGINIGFGGGVYFNKSIGVVLTAGYFWGKHISGESIMIRRSFNKPLLYEGKLNDYRYSQSNYLSYYKSWSVCPTLLYRFVLHKGFVYSLLGISYSIRTSYGITNYVTKLFYQGEFVEERLSKESTIYKEKSFILGIICGIGYCYPISHKIEVMAQVAMTNQRHLKEFKQLLKGYYPTDNGIALSMGIKYNLRPTNLAKQ